MKRSITVTALFVFLTIMAILFSACASEESERSDKVQLSNIRFSDSELSDAERALLEQVESILKSAQLNVAASDDDILISENTTDQTLDISFYVNLYDADHKIICTESTDLENWKPGEQTEICLWRYNSRSNGVESAEIMAEYTYGNAYYRTDLIPIARNEKGKQTGDRITLKVKGGIPCRVTARNWDSESVYELQSFTYTEETYTPDHYTFTFLLRKVSGDSQSMEGLEYRIVRDDGVVCDTGEIYMYYLSNGETILIQDEYKDLPPGDYSLELLSF